MAPTTHKPVIDGTAAMAADIIAATHALIAATIGALDVVTGDATAGSLAMAGAATAAMVAMAPRLVVTVGPSFKEARLLPRRQRQLRRAPRLKRRHGTGK